LILENLRGELLESLNQFIPGLARQKFSSMPKVTTPRLRGDPGMSRRGFIQGLSLIDVNVYSLHDQEAGEDDVPDWFYDSPLTGSNYR